MAAIRQYYWASRKMMARVISPFLFIGGFVSAILGIVVAAAVALMPGLFLIFCGIAGIAIGHIIDLLREIESDLAAIRARLDSGVLGLLPDLMKMSR